MGLEQEVMAASGAGAKWTGLDPRVSWQGRRGVSVVNEMTEGDLVLSMYKYDPRLAIERAIVYLSTVFATMSAYTRDGGKCCPLSVLIPSPSTAPILDIWIKASFASAAVSHHRCCPCKMS